MEKGDCLSLMQQMDSGSVDVIIQDPPYDEKTHEGMINADGKVQLGFDALSNMNHVREALRVARLWVVCFCSLEQLGEYKLFAGDKWVRAGIWEKTNAQPQKSGDRPGQGAEGIAIMHAIGKRMSWNGGGRPAIWRGPRGNCEHHPNQKPEWLMEALIRDFTSYGDTVLDGYAGSGSTGVAAVRCGRNFIGIEMLDKHHRTATMRLRGAHEQPELSFKKRKKPKQLKFTGGSDVKEESKEGTTVGDVEEEGSVSGDLLGERADQADAHLEVEGGEGEPRGVVPDVVVEGFSDKDDPFEETDHTPGPEDFGDEDFGPEDERDPDEKGDAIRNGDFD
jgi:site-specific DNA-methyltransferase (adenine-specific)